MSLANEKIDIMFVLDDEMLNVGVVEELSTLCLGEDEVGEENEADPGVEREPTNNENGP